ncbi:peptide-methionine (R)-S-oxide reductase [Mycobacterium kubicae]
MSDQNRSAAVDALSAEQYRVTQQNCTELPLTGEYCGDLGPNLG